MSAVPSTPVTSAATTAQELYERYRPQLFAFCLHRLGSREEAEDAVQSTFLKAFRSLQRGVEPRVGGAWLFKIAENVCSSRQRSSSRRRRVESTSDLHALQDVLPSRGGDADELFGLTEALGAMPPKQRRALLLREWHGLSYAEISSELELSQSAVETLLFRARRSLARGLEEPPEPERPTRRMRLRAGELGSFLTVLKTLLFGGGAKVAVTVATVAATSVAVSPPVRHEVEHAAAGGARIAEAAARPILYPAQKPASRPAQRVAAIDRAPAAAPAVPAQPAPVNVRTLPEPVSSAAAPRVVRDPLPTVSERHVAPHAGRKTRAAAVPAHPGRSHSSAREHESPAKVAGEPEHVTEPKTPKEHAARAAASEEPKRPKASESRGGRERSGGGRSKAAAAEAATPAVVETPGHRRASETATLRDTTEKGAHRAAAAKEAKPDRHAVSSAPVPLLSKHERADKARGADAAAGKTHAASVHDAERAQRSDRARQTDRGQPNDKAPRNDTARRGEEPRTQVEPHAEVTPPPTEVSTAAVSPEPVEGAAPPEGDTRRR